MPKPNFHGLLRGLFYAFLLCAGFTAQAKDSEKGLLWRLEAPSGKVSYLFGTMHTDDARVNDFSPPLMQALNDSEVFMMETLPTKDGSIFLMPDAGNLRDLLNERELDKVTVLADFHAMDVDNVMRMKPWLLAVIFDLPKPQTPDAQDEQLMAMAGNQSKELLGLENSNEHFSTLDSISLQDQLAMLRAVLKHSQAAKERDFERLVKAYLSGDTAKVAALDDKMTGEIFPGKLWAKLRVKLIDERNVRMAERIALQANNHAVFVAVGAAHLPGKNGLIARLRKAGFVVNTVPQTGNN